jgi:hypothetical protein
VRPAAGRAYRFLLLLYPAEFRRDYGEGMTRVFGELQREERLRGGFGPVVFWIRILTDLARSAAREHMETLFHGGSPRGRRPRSIWPAFAGTALALILGAEAFLRAVAGHPAAAQGPDPRQASDVFLFVVVGAMAPVTLCILLAVGIALTVQKRRLRLSKNR